MPLLSRKQQIAAKVEGTEGTAETLAAADAAFNTFDVQFTPDIQQIERNPNRSTIGNLPSIAGVRLGSVRFRTELVGSGDGSDNTPPFATLMKGCGFQESTASTVLTISSASGTFLPGEQISNGAGGTTTVVVGNVESADTLYTATVSGSLTNGDTLTGSVSGVTATYTSESADNAVAYRPDSTGGSSLTIGVYQDGRRHLLRGCRGNVVMRGAVGDVVGLEFEFTGAIQSTTDVALLSGISFPSSIPPQFLGVGLALDTFSPVFETLEMDMSNDLAPRRDANDSTGVISTKITARSPRGTLDPEAMLIGAGNAQDFYNKLYAGTQYDASFIVGSTSGNKFLCHMPKLQYGNVSAGDRNAILTDNIDLRLSETGEDDDIVIACI